MQIISLFFPLSMLLPPPNGSSMAMQVNARTHSEPFMAAKSFHIPPPQTFYMLMKFFHIPPWTFYGNEIFPHLRIPLPPHTHTPRIFYGSFTPPPILSLQCHIMDPLTVFGPPHILSLQCHIMDNG